MRLWWVCGLIIVSVFVGDVRFGELVCMGCFCLVVVWWVRLC